MLPTLERAVDALIHDRRRFVATVVGSVADDGEWWVARRAGHRRHQAAGVLDGRRLRPTGRPDS